MKISPNPQTSSSHDLLSALGTTRLEGLSDAEARTRLTEYGKNTIEGKESQSLTRLAISQFINPMALLLIFAAVLSFVFKEWLDAIAIIIVILVNAVIGFLMEFQAGRAMATLKKMVTVSSKVVRNGKLGEISAEGIVPGDILFVEAGDIISADARILNCSHFQVDESSLTGESLGVEKQSDALPEEKPLAERSNLIFKGTSVTMGNATAVVVDTGMKSEFGKIARMLQEADQEATPLEKKLSQFSKKLIVITAGLVVVIFAAGILNGHPFLQMLETSIALAVAAIPEGLPIVTTLALAQGMLKMASQNVIVRKLAAVETLGGTSVICTDKTGTLTENKIEVGAVISFGVNLKVKKDSVGRMSLDSPDHREIEISDSFQIIKLVAALCNTSDVIIQADEVLEVGDPLETGLQKFALAFDTDLSQVRATYPKVDEMPFSSETKVMATLHHSSSSYFLAAKGAAEELIERCVAIKEGENVVPLSDHLKKWWLKEAERISGHGLRTLALAYRHSNDVPSNLGEGLTLLALVGLHDPPRAQVAEAIRECKNAGIKVVMVTGDHPSTAQNIAFQLGITNTQAGAVINGKDMPRAEEIDEPTRQRWLSTPIFARVSPQQKLDLITVFQKNHDVVGMTGDGVNDAPALKKADIGIAMGLRGTQVTQQVADMVLKDDSFTSIVAAIRQGRAIFENIRKFVIYLLSCNVSELLIVAVASIFNFHFQLFALQILFINIVTDVLPALALGVTEANPNIMMRSPRASSESLIGKSQWLSIFSYAAVLTFTCMGAVLFCHLTIDVNGTQGHEVCNNILFFTLILSQLLHVFNMAFGEPRRLFNNEVGKNKYVWFAIAACLSIVVMTYSIPLVRTALSIATLSWYHWSIAFVFSLTGLAINQVLKQTKIIN